MLTPFCMLHEIIDVDICNMQQDYRVRMSTQDLGVSATAAAAAYKSRLATNV